MILGLPRQSLSFRTRETVPSGYGLSGVCTLGGRNQQTYSPTVFDATSAPEWRYTRMWTLYSWYAVRV